MPDASARAVSPRLSLPRSLARVASVAAWALGVALAYALAIAAGHWLIATGVVFAPLWPPGAVLLAALLLLPPRRWWSVLLAAVVAHVVTHPADPPATQGVFYLSGAGTAAFGAGTLRRLAGPDLRFDRLRPMALFIALAGLVGPALVSGITAAGVAAFGVGHAGRLHDGQPTTWDVRFFSTALAVLLLVPVLTALARWVAAGAPRPRRERVIEGLLVALVLTGASAIAAAPFADGAAAAAFRLILPLPFALWAAARFRPHAVSAVLGVSLLASALAAANGHGPLVGASSAANVLSLQIVVTAIAVPALLLSALMRETEDTAAAVRRSEERMSLALDASQTGTWDFDLATGRIDWSDINRRILGAAEDEPPTRPEEFLALVHPDDRERLRRVLAPALAGSGEIDSDFRALRPDGSVRWIHGRGVVVRDEAGRAIRVVGINIDTTERRAAEAALRESESRNRAILAALPDLMFVIDRAGTYVDFHAGDPSELLVPPEQFLGRTVREVMPPHIAEPVEAAIDEALRTGGPVVVEYTLPFRGKPSHYEARIVRLGPDRVLSVIRDVTERKDAEAAVAQREEALRRSHAEARALAARLLVAQEDERRRVAREIHDDVVQQVAALGIALSTVKRRLPPKLAAEDGPFADLQRRVDALAESVRAISHRLHSAVLDEAGLVTALRSHCADVGRAAGIDIRVEAGEGLERIPGDCAVVAYRVVQEALRNVVKHAGATEAEVAVWRAGDDLHIRISDPGAGFDAGDAGELGRRAGLGLVSMAERARLAGGSLTVHSRPHAGTRVEARIPLQG